MQIIFLFKGYTPLLRAAINGDLDIVDLLINKEADVNAQNDDGKFLILFFTV